MEDAGEAPPAEAMEEVPGPEDAPDAGPAPDAEDQDAPEAEAQPTEGEAEP